MAPADVARAALLRAKAAARAKGLRPGSPARRSPLEEPRLSGARAGGRDPQTLSDIVGKLLRERGWKEEVSVGGVIGRWREIVGDDIADHAEPQSFDNKILVVRASSTPWATQLKILRSTILGRISQEIGDGVVEDLEILGPTGPGFNKAGQKLRVRGGRGPRDTWG
jgi:predicted nucleic acid-binding Zn ribbon protein